MMTKPRQLEHTLRINGTEYQLVGALLHNGSHYRSLFLLEGKFLQYDGMWKRMKWLDIDHVYGNNFKAAKLWYHRIDNVSEEWKSLMCSASLPNISVISRRGDQVLGIRCKQCNRTISNHPQWAS